ncbi:hypothetical protein [Streptomyces anulatus]|uniref:hypothetical protein n=1 Tax=Streptomyces anulatus TaxID=1892 RepID=UPI00343B513B
MPKKADSGEATVDLLDYLFGPADHDERTDPHLITAWDPDLPCSARTPGRIMLSALGLLLDDPVDALRGPRPAEHVWHTSIRSAPTDRILTDTEWATVAAEMVHAAGVAPHGDEHGCRWVAVRHAPDHIQGLPHPVQPLNERRPDFAALGHTIDYRLRLRSHLIWATRYSVSHGGDR